jgi:methylmalonyl-CoA mutase N-terminal domain/subunit
MTAESPRELTSHSGVPLKELYTPEDIKGLDYERDLGYPGQPPFTRGVYRTMYRGQQFSIRRFTGVETPEQTNELYKEELRLGQNGLAIAPDVPTSTSLDSDNPRCEGDVGFCGVPIDTVEDMEIIFKDIPIEKVTCWCYTPYITGLYFAMAEKRGVDLKALGGTTPAMGIFVPVPVDIPFKVSLDGEIRMAMDFAEWTALNVPNWHNTSVSVYGQKDNGMNNIQALGLLIAASVEAADTWKARGRMPLEQFFRRISFEMAIANDMFEEICTLRAARRLWAKVCQERYGLTDRKLMQFRVRVQTSGCTNTRQEPLNNIIRIAYHMLSGCLGGAQTMHPNGYDEALCIPTDQSMLLSIRTLQILQDETNVTAVIDPLGGSYYVEWLTGEIEKRGWEYYRKIEGMGGICKATRSGFFVNEYKKANLDWDEKVDSGERVVIGVNKYRMRPEDVPYKVPIYKFKPTAGREKIAKLRKYKMERDNARVLAALERLERACTSEDENIFEQLVLVYRAGATIQEGTDVCRKVYGLDTVQLMKL